MKALSVKEESSESESDVDEEMVVEEDEEEDVLSEEKTDQVRTLRAGLGPVARAGHSRLQLSALMQDKRTMSSGSSRRDDDDFPQQRRFHSRR